MRGLSDAPAGHTSHILEGDKCPQTNNKQLSAQITNLLKNVQIIVNKSLCMYTYVRIETCVQRLTWNGSVLGAGQQQVEVLSVSCLLLKPRLQNRFHGNHTVFHPLQVDLRP